MAEKTLIKHLLSKWGILSAELIQAMDADNTVIHEDGSKTYVEVDDNIIEAEVVEVPQAEKTEDSVNNSNEPTQDAATALFGQV